MLVKRREEKRSLSFPFPWLTDRHRGRCGVAQVGGSEPGREQLQTSGEGPARHRSAQLAGERFRGVSGFRDDVVGDRHERPAADELLLLLLLLLLAAVSSMRIEQQQQAAHLAGGDVRGGLERADDGRGHRRGVARVGRELARSQPQNGLQQTSPPVPLTATQYSARALQTCVACKTCSVPAENVGVRVRAWARARVGVCVAVIAGSTEGEGEGESSCGGSEWAALSGAAVVGAGRGGGGAGECDGGAAVAAAVVGRFVVAGGAVVRA